MAPAEAIIARAATMIKKLKKRVDRSGSGVDNARLLRRGGKEKRERQRVSFSKI